MNARRCQGCAAPLPEADAAESQRCPFCGLVHEPRSTGPDERRAVHVHTAKVSDRAAGRLVRWIVGGAVVLTLATLVPVIIAMYAGWRVASSVMPDALSAVPTALSTSPRTLQQLRDLPAGFHALVEVAAPTGGYGTLDAVTALPWALTIAQAWAPDARLERIDLARMRQDGTLNVQDDPEASVTFRFKSPARVAAHREQARLSSSTESGVGLWVRVKSGKPEVFSDVARVSTSGEEPAPHPSAMPLSELVTRPAARALLADAPFFNGYMIHLPDEGWVWYFSTLANEPRPRIRARDAAVWPYRSSR